MNKTEDLTIEEETFLKEKLINNPMRNEEIWKVLDELIIGEDNNKKMLFYVLLSAKLKEKGRTSPLGIYITGSSSGGKTHMVRETLKLFPREMKIVLGGISEKGLRYMEGHLEPIEYEGKNKEGEWKKWRKIIDFTGKILWFLEDTGGEKALSDVRPILSRDQKEIHFTTTVKGKTAKGERFMNQDVFIRGCPSFITTSTKSQILAETGTRVIQISPDESREQSQKIIEDKLKKEMECFTEPDYKPFQYFISNLESKNVWVAFTDLLNLPVFSLNIRRDIEKILNLIKVNCILNQRDRKEIVLGGEKYLVATLDDFFDVMDIALPILKPTLFNIPKKMLTFYEWMMNKRKEDENFQFVTTNISKELKLAQSTVRIYCKGLEDVGKILLTGKEGNANRYEILENDDLPATNATLKVVTPDSLITSFEKVESWLKLTATKSYKGDALFSYLLSIFSFRVTPKKSNDFDSTAFEDFIKAKSNVSVSGVAFRECKRCGLKSPPAILNADGECDICQSKEE